MSLIVMKFGGTSVKDAERLRNVAGIVTDSYKKGNSVVVVVSAQGDTTDDLLLGVYIDPKTDLKDNPATTEADLEFCYFDETTGEYVFTGYVAWKADGTASEKVNVLVATQACQSQGFADAQTALDTVFASIPNFTNP